MTFCQNCGNQTSQKEGFCISCGTPVEVQVNPYWAYKRQILPGQQSTSQKNKIVSILLAVFLTFGTWLYTYKRDGWKFWLGLLLSGLPGLIAAIFLVFYISNLSWLPDDVVIASAYILPMSVWLWAIVDTLRKKGEWYDRH